MKLLYCPTCHDIYNIKHEPKTCLCGATSGMYRSDGLTVDVGGNPVVLGIHNTSFVAAIRNIPLEGMGKEFTAFVVPKNCDRVKKHNHV